MSGFINRASVTHCLSCSGVYFDPTFVKAGAKFPCFSLELFSDSWMVWQVMQLPKRPSWIIFHPGILIKASTDGLTSEKAKHDAKKQHKTLREVNLTFVVIDEIIPQRHSQRYTSYQKKLNIQIRKPRINIYFCQGALISFNPAITLGIIERYPL